MGWDFSTGDFLGGFTLYISLGISVMEWEKGISVGI